MSIYSAEAWASVSLSTQFPPSFREKTVQLTPLRSTFPPAFWVSKGVQD